MRGIVGVAVGEGGVLVGVGVDLGGVGVTVAAVRGEFWRGVQPNSSPIKPMNSKFLFI